jgi:hypothetical protein
MLCGWRVRSEVPLPELPPWSGADRPFDIEIRLGKVADHIDDSVYSSAFLEIARDGSCRFEVEAVGRFLVTAGRSVVVDRNPSGDLASVRLFLLGSVLALLCHQRNVLPMHASAVAVDGKAVLFLGEAGSGKSVLAALCAQAGYRIIADDVCAVEWLADGRAVILPGAPRLLLWRTALDVLNLPCDPMQRVRPELEKYSLAGTGVDDAVPIGMIYQLVIADGLETPVPISQTSDPLNPHGFLHYTKLAQHILGVPALRGRVERFATSAPFYTLRVGRSVEQTVLASRFAITHFSGEVS